MNYNFELLGENVGRVSIFEWCPYPVDNFEGVFEGGVKSLSDGSNVTTDDVDTRADEKAAFRISW